MSITSFEEMFKSTLNSVVEKKGADGIEITESKLLEVIENVLGDDLFSEIAETIFNSLQQIMYETLEKDRLEQQEFTSRLKQRWLSPLAKLDSLIIISAEICTDSINTTNEIRYEGDGTSYTNLKYNILMKLLAKLIVTSKEISYLLKGGFADAAISRWRSLHEMNTIIQVFSRYYKKEDVIRILYHFKTIWKRISF